MAIGHTLKRKLAGARFRATRKLPFVDPAEVWPGLSSADVRMRPFAGKPDNVDRYELALICAAVRLVAPRAMFEFGTYDGLTSWHLAANAPEGARLHTLDLPIDHPTRRADASVPGTGHVKDVIPGERFHGTPEGARIEQIYCDSMDFDPRPFAGSIDFCFVDASHAYEHVKKDTDNALRITRPGGTILWHDYSRWWTGVQRALDERAGELPLRAIRRTSLATLIVPARAS